MSKLSFSQQRLAELEAAVSAIDGVEIRPREMREMPFYGPGGLWSVTPPADYEEGWMWGERMALAALLYTGTDLEVPAVAVHLRSVALAQAERGVPTDGHKGAILGFWGVVGTLLAEVATPADVEILAARLERRYEWYAAQEAKRGREISKRCRRAALIGVAKRRAAKKGRRAAA